MMTQYESAPEGASHEERMRIRARNMARFHAQTKDAHKSEYVQQVAEGKHGDDIKQEVETIIRRKGRRTPYTPVSTKPPEEEVETAPAEKVDEPEIKETPKWRDKARDTFDTIFSPFKKRPEVDMVHPDDPVHIVVDKDEPDKAKVVGRVLGDVHYTDEGYKKDVEIIRDDIRAQEEEIRKADTYLQEYSIEIKRIDREIQNVQAQAEGTTYVDSSGKEFTKRQYLSKLRGWKNQYQKAYNDTVKFKGEARSGIEKMKEGKTTFVKSVKDFGRQLKENVLYASPDGLMILETPKKTKADIERDDILGKITTAYERTHDVKKGVSDLTQPDLSKPLSPTEMVKFTTSPATRKLDVGLQLFGGMLLDPLHVHEETGDLHLAVGSIIGSRFKDVSGLERDPEKRAKLFTDSVVEFKTARAGTKFDLDTGEFIHKGGKGWRIGDEGRLEVRDLDYGDMTKMEKMVGGVSRVSDQVIATPLGKTILTTPVVATTGFLAGATITGTKAYALGRYGAGAWQLKTLTGAGLVLKGGVMGYYGKSKLDLYQEHGMDAVKLSVSRDIPTFVTLGYGYKAGARVPRLSQEYYYKGVAKRDLVIQQELKGDILQFGEKGVMGMTGKVRIVDTHKPLLKPAKVRELYKRAGLQEVSYRINADKVVNYASYTKIGDPTDLVYVKGHKHPFTHTPRTLHPAHPTIDLMNIKIKPTKFDIDALTEFTFKPSAPTKVTQTYGQYTGYTPPTKPDIFTAFSGKTKFQFPAEKVVMTGKKATFTSPDKLSPAVRIEKTFDIRGWNVHDTTVPTKTTMKFISGKGFVDGSTKLTYKQVGLESSKLVSKQVGLESSKLVSKQVMLDPSKTVSAFSGQLKADAWTGFTQKELGAMRFKPEAVPVTVGMSKLKLEPALKLKPSLKIASRSKIDTKTITKTRLAQAQTMDTKTRLAQAQTMDTKTITKTRLAQAQKTKQIQIPAIKQVSLTKTTFVSHKPLFPTLFKPPSPPSTGFFTPAFSVPKRKVVSPKKRRGAIPKKAKPLFGYTPSLTAIMQGITVPARKKKEDEWFTGLEMRPIRKTVKRKKRRRSIVDMI